MVIAATQDRRIRRTQHLLAQALIALTLEKGYEVVTIREITERADVGYATFFRHYRDKDELLQDVLEVVLAELQALLAATDPAADPAGVGLLVFRYVEGHSAIVRVLLGRPALLQGLIARVVAQVAAEQGAAWAGGVVPVEVAAHHIVSATIALIGWWLDHGMPYPPERMGQIYAALIAGPLMRNEE